MAALREEDLALRGAKILRRYHHPDDWESGNSTGVFSLRRCRALCVNELHLGTPVPGGAPNDPDRVRRNAQAILACARGLGLKPHQLRIHQRPGSTSYVYVPEGDWDIVLPRLQSLLGEHTQQ